MDEFLNESRMLLTVSREDLRAPPKRCLRLQGGWRAGAADPVAHIDQQVFVARRLRKSA